MAPLFDLLLHPCVGGKSSIGFTDEETEACRCDLVTGPDSGSAESWKPL